MIDLKAIRLRWLARWNGTPPPITIEPGRLGSSVGFPTPGTEADPYPALPPFLDRRRKHDVEG